MKKPPSLIKWTGSKRSQSEEIVKLFPEAKRYIEPFLGGGSILYHASQHFSTCLGNDIYNPLIDIWNLVKNDPKELCHSYEQEWNLLQDTFPEHYYKVRSRFNSEKNAKDLLFLSRTCTNGIIRFNKSGEFNNSLHLTRRGMQPEKFKSIVFDWSIRLKKTSFTCGDFNLLKNSITKNDFLYLDPPYINSKNRYISNLEPEKLFIFLENINETGAKWALSFDGTRGDNDFRSEIPKELYVNKKLLHSGNSAVKKVLSSKVEVVYESLYMNY
ncbi:MAG: DNA adenine methylase [Aureibaculum sp.]|nr:DNA adenine methylase [Aureibaculum sp.]